MDKMLAELSESNRELDAKYKEVVKDREKLAKDNKELNKYLKFSEEKLNKDDNFKMLADKLAEAVKAINILENKLAKTNKAILIYKSVFTWICTCADKIQKTNAEDMPTMQSMRESFEEDGNSSKFAIAGVDPESVMEVYADGLVDGSQYMRVGLLHYMQDMVDEDLDEEVDE